MCGRFVQARQADWAALFDVQHVNMGGWRPSSNLRPTDPVLIVVDPTRRASDDDETAGRHLEAARWSLVPRWAPTLKLRYPTFNARIESAAQKPTFRDAARSTRCLIPADGYYEWQGTGRDRKPYFIAPHPSERPGPELAALSAVGTTQLPLVFAGLYSWWRKTPVSPWVLTATMLTTQATSGLASIHDRMPVFLPRDMWNTWLAPAGDPPSELADAAAAAERVAGHLSAVAAIAEQTTG